MSTDRIRVLFVCLGNICRSPMAEAVFRQLVEDAQLSDRFEIASAGTGDWHIGEPPHRGTLEILAKHGIDGSRQRARHLQSADFDTYHYIAAMDKSNMRDMGGFHRDASRRSFLLLEHARELGVREVPDPYYTGGFDYVYSLVETACQGLLTYIREHEGI